MPVQQVGPDALEDRVISLLIAARWQVNFYAYSQTHAVSIGPPPLAPCGWFDALDPISMGGRTAAFPLERDAFFAGATFLATFVLPAPDDLASSVSSTAFPEMRANA